MGEEVELTKGERTQQQILRAAEGLFLARGYTATSMRQIASAVGITPAAIYNHFKSKDELFTALLRRAAPYDRLFALWDQTQAETPEALLRQVFGSILGLFAGRAEYFRLALIDAQERDGATLRLFLPELVARAMAFHRRLAELDSGHGRLRHISPLVFMRALVSLIVGYLVTEQVGRPDQTLQLPEVDWVQELTDLFLGGVLRSPGSAP